MYGFLFGHEFSVLWGKYPGMWLLGHMVSKCMLSVSFRKLANYFAEWIYQHSYIFHKGIMGKLNVLYVELKGIIHFVFQAPNLELILDVFLMCFICL